MHTIADGEGCVQHRSLLAKQAAAKYKHKIVAKEMHEAHLSNVEVPKDEVASVFSDAQKAIVTSMEQGSDEDEDASDEGDEGDDVEESDED
eukprot:m.30929 g.30929  ORF g.30929 m.30929 type:complete len:91 (+) comp12016_c0_seq3:1095-1367(+)